MLFDQAVAAVAAYGFTARQARFVLTVMRHAGVCLERQYCTFAGIAHGKNSQRFFRTLVTRGYATRHPCGTRRTHLFHIHAKALYRAMNEPEHRHRHRPSLPRAIERLMLLDGVLAAPDRTWLGSAHEKVQYFGARYGVAEADQPAVKGTARGGAVWQFFPDVLPIGVGDGHETVLFLFLVVEPTSLKFREFLQRHAALLRALPSWEIRLLVPRCRAAALGSYEAAFREQVQEPLHPTIAQELRWYFAARQHRRPEAQERFDGAVRGFGAAHFRVLYRDWLDRGDQVLEAAMSPTLARAVAEGGGRIGRLMLPPVYPQLEGLIGTA
ncbi:MAG: hypothetical protein KGN76_18475 [Acidobacteriota bacterium]|nr:hypothetical protein [Acidobacteriota bacterium]